MGGCISTGPKQTPQEEEAERVSKVEETRRNQPLRTNLVHQTAVETPEDKYQVVKLLGVGSMGSVSLVRLCNRKSHNEDSEQLFALKTLRVGRITQQYLRELQNEIRTVSNLDHPGIVKFYQVYHTQSTISIVMELCSGGDLFSREPYTEREAADVVQQVLSAVAYMHSRGYVHRDIKVCSQCARLPACLPMSSLGHSHMSNLLHPL